MSIRKQDEMYTTADKILTKRLYYMQSKFDREDLDLAIEYDLDFNRMIARLETLVFSENLLTDTKAVEFYTYTPTTTWQMFKWLHKDAWWMRWWTGHFEDKHWIRGRGPVKLKSRKHSYDVKFERYALFPHSTIDSKKLGRAVINEQYNVICKDDYYDDED